MLKKRLIASLFLSILMISDASAQSVNFLSKKYWQKARTQSVYNAIQQGHDVNRRGSTGWPPLNVCKSL